MMIMTVQLAAASSSTASCGWCFLVILLATVTSQIHAFHAPKPITITPARQQHSFDVTRQSSWSVLYQTSGSNDNDDIDATSPADMNNPYADPNYPDLEFIDYSNPNYVVDQGGVDDEFFPKSDDTDEQIEAMREERRRRNDEYQFETYYAKVLQQGQEYRGEWTVYHTDTFLNNDDATSSSSTTTSKFAKEEEIAPRLVPFPRTLQVISKGYKIQVVEDPSLVPFRVDAERICHVERMVLMNDDDEDNSSPQQTSQTSQQTLLVDDILNNQYWPLQLCARDFRGDMGIMCVGNAYTICNSRPLLLAAAASTDVATATVAAMSNDATKDAECVGPFAEHWTELGLSADRLRLRIKLHYSVLSDQDAAADIHPTAASKKAPPLYLKSLTVCREMLDMWPSDAATTFPVAWDALFGSTGAPGGLFDPPPVGSADQARHYRLIELPGRATILIPVQLDQHHEKSSASSSSQVAGWVTSLDWASPLAMRYQVDRKVKGGNYISGLRTLELSEIQSENAEQYRPRDGGQDMRQ